MNKITITLTAVGATLLVAVVALTFLFIGQGTNATIDAQQDSPGTETSQTPAPPVTGTADAPIQQPVTSGSNGSDGSGNSAPAPAVDDSLRFLTFGADLQVYCDSNADEKAQPLISWSAANAVAVYWTPSNQDATADNGYQVGSSGTQEDMSISKGPGERYEFPCNHRQTFDTTITIYGSDGQKVSKHVTFTDVNWGIDLGSDDDD